MSPWIEVQICYLILSNMQQDLFGAIFCHSLQARSLYPQIWCSHPDQSVQQETEYGQGFAAEELEHTSCLLHTAAIRQSLFFPDRRLVQFDCGKLQVCPWAQIVLCTPHSFHNMITTIAVLMKDTHSQWGCLCTFVTSQLLHFVNSFRAHAASLSFPNGKRGSVWGPHRLVKTYTKPILASSEVVRHCRSWLSFFTRWKQEVTKPWFSLRWQRCWTF